MMRFVFVAATILSGINVVLAQDAAGSGRSQMKANNDAIGVLAAIAKGDKPYDQAVVDAALARLDECTRKLPTLYPESMKGAQTDARFSPSDKVWSDKARFAAQITSFGAAVAEAKSKVKDVDALKTSVDSIGKQCGDCHQTFRVRNG